MSSSTDGWRPTAAMHSTGWVVKDGELTFDAGGLWSKTTATKTLFMEQKNLKTLISYLGGNYQSWK
jgi:hypothetical protein